MSVMSSNSTSCNLCGAAVSAILPLAATSLEIAVFVFDVFTTICANSTVWYCLLMPSSPVTSKAKPKHAEAASRTAPKGWKRPYQHKRDPSSTRRAARTSGGSEQMSEVAIGSQTSGALSSNISSVVTARMTGVGTKPSLWPCLESPLERTGEVFARTAESAAPSRRPGPARGPCDNSVPTSSCTATLKSEKLCPSPRSEASSRHNCHAKAHRPRQTSSVRKVLRTSSSNILKRSS
mmetsp:Transcript_5071/g.14065  ORF Transcript_5071/g.14065 Transcript_5071/m.14065 type:complete len:236 (+) Transcript_5071:1712-2419(+)